MLYVKLIKTFGMSYFMWNWSKVCGTIYFMWNLGKGYGVFCLMKHTCVVFILKN